MQRVYIFLLLCSCSTPSPTFDADITDKDGKKVAHVVGHVQDNKSWLERYAGPVGALITGILYAMTPAAYTTTP